MKELKQLKTSELSELREQLIVEQNGICPICGKPINKPVVDHQHKKRIKGTGQVRGVICSSCNVFLAKSENNCTRYNISLEELPNVLRNIADYLEAEQLPLIHPTEKEKESKVSKKNYNKLKKLYDEVNHRKKFPEYPKSGKLTNSLKVLFATFGVSPYN